MRPALATVALSVALGPVLAPPAIVADAQVPELPEIGAEAWLLSDADTGITIAEHNSREARPMASVTWQSIFGP